MLDDFQVTNDSKATDAWLQLVAVSGHLSKATMLTLYSCTKEVHIMESVSVAVAPKYI